MMIECLLGGGALAALIWSRNDKKTELMVESLEEIRDNILLCSRRSDYYNTLHNIVTRDLQSLHGKIKHDDKLFEMLKILQKEWKDVQDSYRVLEYRQTESGYDNSSLYYI